MSSAILATTNEGRSAESSTSTDRYSRADWIEAIGRHSVRYSLVLVLIWIGGMKFSAYEADAISGMVSNSPLMSWVYGIFSVRQFSNVLGFVEVAIALMIAVRPIWARISAIGSFLAVGMFVTTLSFLLSTPGVVEPSLGFPGLTVVPGQFLLKDFVLLGAAVWSFGEAVNPHRGRNMEPQK